MLYGSVLLTVLLGCALVSFAAGLMGAVVSLRARNLEADVLAHCTLPGLVLGIIVSQLLGLGGTALTQLLMIVGGILTAVVASLGLAYFTARAARTLSVKSDAIQATLLGLGFGLGLVLLSLVQSYLPSQRVGLNQLLIGNAAVLTLNDVWLGLALCIALGLALVAMRRTIAQFLFDKTAWQQSGGRPWLAEALYAAGLFCVMVVGMRLVGVVLMVALFTIPFLLVHNWVRGHFLALVFASGVAAAIGSAVGVWTSALPVGTQDAGLPTGPSIVLALFMLLLVSQGVLFLLCPSQVKGGVVGDGRA